MKTIFYIIILILFFCENNYGAEIRLDKNPFGNMIFFNGKIEKGDLSKLISSLKEEELIPSDLNPLPEIRITSEGGSIDEALKIGKFIRSSLLPVTAVDHCYSSCFVILASSVDRRIFGKTSIGIHRPYYDKDYFSGLSIEEANYKYKKLQNETSMYLIEMNVPRTIVDDMFNVSSDNIRILGNELDKILGRTPIYDEWIKSKCDELTVSEDNDLGLLRSKKFNSSKGYSDYLENKYQKFFDCKAASTLKEYKKILNEYKK